MRSLAHVRDKLTCNLCGMPLEVCRASANEKKFSVDYERCFAMAAMHREQRKMQGSDGSVAAIDDPQSLAFSISLKS